MVMDWEQWRVIREILPMKYCDMPDNDKAPLLDAHNRYSIEDVKGDAKKWKSEDEKLVCKSFISEAEPEIRTKVKEGRN